MSMSVPVSNETCSVIVPSLPEIACMEIIRLAPFTCASIGVATDCSTVIASAPVYMAVVWIWGGAISGNCATGSRNTITAPPSTKKMAMTIATIGRSMKNLDMVRLSLPGRRGRGRGRCVGLGTHDDPVFDLLEALRHDAFARLEPFSDDPEPVDLFAGLHCAERDLVVRSDDRDLVRALDLLHRLRRHEKGAPDGLRRRAYLGVQAGAEDGIGVREERLDQDRPRLLVDLPVRDVQPARTGIRAPVGEEELKLRFVRCPALLLVLLDLIGEVQVLTLGDREGHLHRIDLGDDGEDGRRGHEIADLDRCDPGDAVDR